MRKLVHQQLSYQLTGIFFNVHKKLGRFCREKQYADCIEKLIQETKIPYKREIEIQLLNSSSPKGNKIDFIIDNKIIIDTKAKPFITKEDYRQMQRYLQSANIELGLIVNFRSLYLKPKRILNIKLFHSEHSDGNSDYSDRLKQ
ncbi:GxxExxY protein [Candidatus Roizmanbacteria bacterium]|nr:GxxExxY protein [Candidatus Roizmanbacteria bacterium]